MSDCETVAQQLGIAVDDDLNTTMVPDTCCGKCHEKGSAQMTHLVINKVRYVVCCGIRTVHHRHQPHSAPKVRGFRADGSAILEDDDE